MSDAALRLKEIRAIDVPRHSTQLKEIAQRFVMSLSTVVIMFKMLKPADTLGKLGITF